MDAIEQDILAFVKQNIIRKLISESEHLSLPVTHPEIIRTTVGYCDLGPHPHRAFTMLMRQLETTIQVSFRGFPTLSGCNTYSSVLQSQALRGQSQA